MKDLVMLGFLSIIMCANFASWSLFGSSGNVFRSAATTATLVELYSSEGCSSCPPADHWMSKLESASGLWTTFVPVAFHVDYWDYLGWKDPIASAAYSARQRDYAQSWGRSGTYTPGVVVNGDELRSWTRYEPTSNKTKAGVLEVRELSGGRYAVTFEPARGAANWQVNVALLGFGIVSKITAGENNGKTITHDFVVLNQVHSTLAPKGKAFAAEVSLDKPQSALSVPRYGIAAWVSPIGQMKPEQATGGFLK